MGFITSLWKSTPWLAGLLILVNVYINKFSDQITIEYLLLPGLAITFIVLGFIIDFLWIKHAQGTMKLALFLRKILHVLKHLVCAASVVVLIILAMGGMV